MGSDSSALIIPYQVAIWSLQLVTTNFPDTNGTLFSPAFTSPETRLPGFVNGPDGPTDDTTLDLFLRSIAERSEWAEYKVADHTSEEGPSFPYIVVSKSSPAESDLAPKLRVWVQVIRTHGFPVACTATNQQATRQFLALLGKLDADRGWRGTLLERLVITLLPRYNPDGVAYFQRALASNLDPNREHTKLAREMSRGPQAAAERVPIIVRSSLVTWLPR
ncbi:hypothetical protein GGR53DRAFT_466933 [Hypoxylon sp. FL1150]|nr:hypothetical protein GGR53DRAFT_466933 [Hypoxylon sp. FL1150]